MSQNFQKEIAKEMAYYLKGESPHELQNAHCINVNKFEGIDAKI